MFGCHSDHCLLSNMVRITIEMVRRKSEHNEGEISTLEELSLHQEDIEKIEGVQNWCKHLEILLLQSNLIPKIENLWKLKKLVYLNLALNNIEKIEGLERLESLEKLDLTLNFIGELTSVENLKNNYNLRLLYLTGNPCTDYKGYRDYVITELTQIQELDSRFIERSDRLKAIQIFQTVKTNILSEQDVYKQKRDRERLSKKKFIQDRRDDEGDEEMTQEQLAEYWNSPSSNTPEDRIQIAKMSKRHQNRNKNEKKEKVKEIKLVNKDGKRLNINQPKLDIKIIDDDNDETGCKILDIAVYKHLDTSYIDVDLQPSYVTVRVKGKVVQIVFDEEIIVDKSTCQRSQTTGHLVIKMPRLNFTPKLKKAQETTGREINKKHEEEKGFFNSKRQYLEIGPQDLTMDFSKITEVKTNERHVKKVEEKIPGPDFVDDEDVPPLL